MTLIETQQPLRLTDINGVIAEMRTPLLELKLLTEAGDLATSREVAEQTLALFDSFLFARRLDREVNGQSLVSSPHSLATVTATVLHQVAPLAKLYGVNLDFSPGKESKTMGVHLPKVAFEHATRSLLHSLISALQNKPQALLRIRLSYRQLPTLKFFSRDIDNLVAKNIEQAQGVAKSKPNPFCSGLGSGMLVANLIYRHMGSNLNFVANQYGHGLAVHFKTIRQMSLVESLT